MAKQFDALTPEHRQFIEAQKIFFVGTATQEGYVNVSPKGQDTLRVIHSNELVWLNLTGSGNETAAHILDTNRMTLMWCAFEGPPEILRLYGTATLIHPRDSDWQHCASLIPAPPGARQYFRVHVHLVQTSCGFSVPCFEYKGDRQTLNQWAEKKGDAGIADYWAEKNVTSMNGLPTQIFES
ncbi:MAG: pyridoxamine 5'-phosphate oxidase family protein [Elainellaceae cyanobacterium]